MEKINTEPIYEINDLVNIILKVSKLDIKLDNLLNILTEEYSISYEKAKANYILEEDKSEEEKEDNKKTINFIL